MEIFLGPQFFSLINFFFRMKIQKTAASEICRHIKFNYVRNLEQQMQILITALEINFFFRNFIFNSNKRSDQLTE